MSSLVAVILGGAGLVHAMEVHCGGVWISAIAIALGLLPWTLVFYVIRSL